jgi:hypothetical protein
MRTSRNFFFVSSYFTTHIRLPRYRRIINLNMTHSKQITVPINNIDTIMS